MTQPDLRLYHEILRLKRERKMKEVIEKINQEIIEEIIKDEIQ